MCICLLVSCPTSWLATGASSTDAPGANKDDVSAPQTDNVWIVQAARWWEVVRSGRKWSGRGGRKSGGASRTAKNNAPTRRSSPSRRRPPLLRRSPSSISLSEVLHGRRGSLVRPNAMRSRSDVSSPLRLSRAWKTLQLLLNIQQRSRKLLAVAPRLWYRHRNFRWTLRLW